MFQALKHLFRPNWHVQHTLIHSISTSRLPEAQSARNSNNCQLSHKIVLAILHKHYIISCYVSLGHNLFKKIVEM